MNQTFLMLYPLVTILSASAYFPQIVTLLRASSPVDGISLSSWAVWILSSVISLGYGIFNLQDFLFCLTTGLGLALMLVIVGLVLYNRHVRFRPRTAIVTQ